MSGFLDWLSALAGSLLASGAVPDGGVLRAEARYVLPLAEVSGLAQRTGPGGGMEILAVGDADHRVVRFDATGGLEPLAHELARGPGASQWESVAADGRGNLWILSEDSGRILGVDPEFRPLANPLRLDVSSLPDLARVWAAEVNSRGEGLLLLRQGHLLVLKEKQPGLLVEFGPAGAVPFGYGPGTFLEPGAGFEPSPDGRLVALAYWPLARELAAIARDGSELTLGPDGRVYLLSQESASLIRLVETLGPRDRELRPAAFWRLPGDIDKAEGLVIDQDLRPWVAVDRKGMDKPNLFRLTSLGATRP